MKTPFIQSDLENALRLLNKTMPETEAEIDAFIAEVESEAHKLPPTPPHLTPSAIAKAVSKGKRPQPSIYFRTTAWMLLKANGFMSLFRKKQNRRRENRKTFHHTAAADDGVRYPQD